MDFRFYDPAVPPLVTQGHLPHWEQEDSTYFITWRTADSIPKQRAEYWHRLRAEWLRDHGISPDDSNWRRQVEVLPEEVRKEFRRFSRALDEEMDACHGECLLKQRDCAAIISDALRYFEGERYLLGDFVVMPNHVRVLVGGMPRDAMKGQVKSWKRWSALGINKRLSRRGRFWQSESFDHLVRSQAAFDRFRRYIAENPVKAGLREGEYYLWEREK